MNEIVKQVRWLRREVPEAVIRAREVQGWEITQASKPAGVRVHDRAQDDASSAIGTVIEVVALFPEEQARFGVPAYAIVCWPHLDDRLAAYRVDGSILE